MTVNANIKLLNPSGCVKSRGGVSETHNREHDPVWREHMHRISHELGGWSFPTRALRMSAYSMRFGLVVFWLSKSRNRIGKSMLGKARKSLKPQLGDVQPTPFGKLRFIHIIFMNCSMRATASGKVKIPHMLDLDIGNNMQRNPTFELGHLWPLLSFCTTHLIHIHFEAPLVVYFPSVQ